MLKHNEANPLAVFQIRRVEHCPPHFTVVKFDTYVTEKSISDWIWENLEGRFYVGDEYVEGADNQTLAIQKVAGFEMPGEASYFSLILNTINQTPEW